MSLHRIKVQPPYFAALACGDKTFEVRRNDRAYQRGDRLVLVDTERGCSCGSASCDLVPAKTLIAEVTYVYSGDPRFGQVIQAGFVVLGLRLIEQT